MAFIPSTREERKRADEEFDTAVCARVSEGGCSGRLTRQHCLGRKNAKPWMQIWLCWRMHLGDKKNKAKDRYIALSGATEQELKAHPKSYAGWKNEIAYGRIKYGEI